MSPTLEPVRGRASRPLRAASVVRRPRSGVVRAAGAAMPQYYEDKPEGGPCAGVKEDLGACLLQSACVLQEGKSPRQCLKEGHCRALQYSFFECKRSMLDTRSRFRGRKGY
ncbi:cytochrome c oxidase assembly factor 5 [Psammomys obesus]|uniref:cytochrome c oxidase assembly factor 5 n=2 Tax=Gerbillinae TaxID=10045 RepID=UPI0024536944|nr:cytochrome c oxidase assembly factor 5 [Psammomys obesus]